jgi:DNA invertase Pin-like site-specific DNA recombinase
MLVAYCRTSSLEQIAGFDAQIEELTKLGCEKIFQEQVSSVAEREELNKAIDFVRDGDVLIVTKLDRLARSISHLWKIVEQLDAKNVGLRIINLGIDTKSATGKLILTVLGGIGQFEREMMLERQREGIEKARLAGKYKGRVPTARRQSTQIIEMRNNGVSVKKITEELNVSRSSVYRILEDAA